MEFKEISINGKKKFYIDNKEATEKAYNFLKEEYMVNEEVEENQCFVCEIVRDIMDIMVEAESGEELYQELHGLVEHMLDVTHAGMLEEIGLNLLEASDEIMCCEEE